MVSEPRKGRASRLPRPRRIAAGLSVALLVPALLIGWLLTTASGARAVFSAMTSLSDGMLQAQGVEGRLSGPLHLQRLTLERTNDSIALTDVHLDWRPSALLQSLLHIKSLHIGRLIVTGRIDAKPEPAKLPDSIALPLALQLDELRVDGGEVNRGPVNLVRLGLFALGASFDGARYQLQLKELAAGSTLADGTLATRFSGQASLAVAKPYALQGSFSSTGNAMLQDRSLGAIGSITLNGSLAGIMTTIDFTVNGAPVNGSATLRPFSEQTLGASRLTAQALDLSSLDSQLPQTALNVRLRVDESGAGEMRLDNPAAGDYGDRKLPLSALAVNFRQQADIFYFDRISAVPGSVRQPAGEVSGNGRYGNGALTLTLRTSSLDLHRIDRRVRATRLAGTVDLRHRGGRQEFTIALSEPVHRHRILLEAHGTLADARLSVDRAQLQAGSGSIDASGHLALAGSRDFRAQGKIDRFRLHDLGDFAQVPALDLNGDFSLEGRRDPQLQADLSFDITDSRLAGQPLSGSGRAQLRDERLLVPRFLLLSGTNRLNIEGRLAEGDARLSFNLNAPQLAQLGPPFGGALQASGVVRGTLAQPRVNAEWSASNARLPGALQFDMMQGKADIAIDRKRDFIIGDAVADVSARGLRYGDNQFAGLTAQVRFAPQPASPLALSIHAKGIAVERLRAESLTFSANGTTAQHVINATLNETGQTWRLKADGGLSQLAAAARWQGRVAELNASGRFNAHLTGPSPLLLSAQRVQLDRFLLDTEAGHIAVEQFARDAGGIVTRGRIERLQLAQLLRQLQAPPPVKTDLQFGGNWDVRITDAPAGNIRLERERGDATILGSTQMTLGLRILNANINAAGGKLSLQLQADGAQLGRININAGTAIGSGAGRYSIAQDAEVSGSALIDVPSLAWLGPLVSPATITDGRIQGEVALGGTFGQPKFSGRIDGNALRVALTDLGLDLREGSLRSEFQGERLLIHNLAFQGHEGRMTLSGPIDLGNGIDAQLLLRAEKFALLNRSDRRLTVSGESRIAWQEQRASVTGAFTVDSGFVDLGSADKPRLSNDVVIVGREKKKAGKMAMALDITVSLGNGVVLRGRGLDALLAGQVRLAGSPDETLQARGTLSIAKGTYAAYGRELAIEQGFVRFTGALDNPALDILAMRRGQEVEAGVSVRGTVLAPRVTLVSEPTVPDAEKLSWLVLGRGLNTVAEGDMGTLQHAASALLSQGASAGVQSGIASAFGLDTFSVGTSQDNLQQHIVTLGKQVSSRLYLGYQQGLETVGSVLQLRYLLSPRLSLEAEAGSRSALSLLYNITFD